MFAPKKCKVSIFNETYSLVSDEPEEHIHTSAQLVDKLLREAVRANPSVDTHHALVLITLRLASNYLKLDFEAEYSKNNQKKVLDLINQELSL